MTNGVTRMNKIVGNLKKWTIDIIFLIPFAIMVMFYVKWFRLTPWVFFDDPTFGFVFGFILLVVHGILVKAWFSSKDTFGRGILFFISILVFGINYLYLDVHIPRLATTTKCNGIRYNISYYAPFGDEQLQYDHLSQWKGLYYKSSGFRYVGSANYKIICDEEKKEANFVDKYTKVLYYTDGENPRQYVEYAGAKLRGHRYFVSRKVSFPGDCVTEISNCAIETYALYECKLDYTSCNPLPIRYTTDIGADTLDLKADKTTNEISLFRHRSRFRYECQYQKCLGGVYKALIFTYGESPRCYVEGCSILNQ